jgi:chromosome segregation ATPase
MSVAEWTAVIAAACSVISVIVIVIFTIAIMKNNQRWFEKTLDKHEESIDKRFEEGRKEIQELFDRSNSLKMDLAETKSVIPVSEKIVHTDICKIITKEIHNSIVNIQEVHEKIKSGLEAVKIDTYGNKKSLEHLTDIIEELLRKLSGLEEKMGELKNNKNGV